MDSGSMFVSPPLCVCRGGRKGLNLLIAGAELRWFLADAATKTKFPLSINVSFLKSSRYTKPKVPVLQS